MRFLATVIALCVMLSVGYWIGYVVATEDSKAKLVQQEQASAELIRAYKQKLDEALTPE